MKKSLIVTVILGSGLLLALGACDPNSENNENPPPVLAKSCLEVCASNADCNEGFTCKDRQCVYNGVVNVPVCTDDDSCVAIRSGWLELTACDAEHLCNYGECVVVEGLGRCVMPPPCTGNNTPVSWPSVLGTEVTVCGIPGYQCRDQVCWKACESSTCSGEQPICADDGNCHCEADSCQGSSDGKVCKENGRCGCKSDSDCTSAQADKCYDGVCGCSSDAVCTEDTSHRGTHWVCE